MTLQEWQKAGVLLADWAQCALREIKRGALQIGDEVIVLFGNDDYASEPEVICEVEAIRQELRRVDVSEIAFQTSTDGAAWVVILRAADPHYETAVGRRFRTEMVKMLLCDVINGAWQEAGGVAMPASPFA